MAAEPAHVRTRTRRLKRALDLAAVVASAPLTLPLGAATAVFVGVRLGRPVLFRQTRAGMNGEPFDLLKFRTMTDERDETGAVLPDSRRLTPAGGLIRTLSLDELPQLINVLRGEMSLVGPRPLLPEYGRHYTTTEARRFDVRPGLTGLAQVQGRNGLGWDERLKADVAYVDGLSLWSDIRILLRTVAQVTRRSGVSPIAGLTGEPLDVERSYPLHDGFRMRRVALRDVLDRVRWMNDPRTRELMQIPEGITVESTIAWLERVVPDPDRVDFVVVDPSGRTAAMMGLRSDPDEPLPELYVFVDPDRHGEGIGRASLTLLIAWLRTSRRFPGCDLSVDRRNAAAVHLYRQMGFAEYDDSEGRLRMRLEIGEAAHG